MDRLTLTRAHFGSLESALATEWLITNGLGGFASGTVAQANTRRYHGLLVAALQPPVDRRLLLSRLEVAVTVGGERHALFGNEFADGTLDPHGYRWLQSFEAIDGRPVWTYQIGATLLRQQIDMTLGENRTVVSIEVLQAPEAIALELTPLCCDRDYHDHARQAQGLRVRAAAQTCLVCDDSGREILQLAVDCGEFHEAPDWYWNFRHRVESERGLDDREHLFRPGRFTASVPAGARLQFVASVPGGTAAAAPRARVTNQPPGRIPPWIQSLTRAASDYIVARHDAQSPEPGTTVIAGYPWFTDWGRDTMIALPGLTLTSGHPETAAQVLRTFARHVDRGMLPNRFPDSAAAAEYNTVDATLWLFHALHCYLEATRDHALLHELWPVLQDIHDWHVRGTRYGIQVDPEDGLLRAGEPGVQLTWMDAKVGDWVVTPRSGKAVEINALWHFALASMARWSALAGERSLSRKLAADAKRTAASFRARFWNDQDGCLFDVLDVDGGTRADPSIRPNQIFAVSLDAALLDPDRARAVVDTCGRHLLTPVGLRSLSPADPAYVGRYEGDARQRDGSYHQGTVWSWLLGPFALAHYRVHGEVSQAQRLLDGIEPHLTEACIGQVSEIFDGDPPHTPRGCFAQAWGVAETLRAWHWLEDKKHG